MLKPVKGWVLFDVMKKQTVVEIDQLKLTLIMKNFSC